MKKIVYLVSIAFYVGVAALGMTGNGYSEVGGSQKILNNNLFLIAAIALGVGSLVAYYFPKIFPKGFVKQSKGGRIFIVIIFFVISFGSTVGIFLFGNASFGHQKLIRVDGYIEKKWFKKKQKGRYDYYIGLRDSISQNYYEFKVKESIYDLVGPVGDKISKDFYRGSLGVIYRYGY
ncbi:MAG TPA: hypothetical protein VF476_17250 [Chitinophagaceae bacterium]